MSKKNVVVAALGMAVALSCVGMPAQARKKEAVKPIGTFVMKQTGPKGKDLQPTSDKMNALIQHYIDTSTPAYCAKTGMVDEIVDMPKLRNYVVAFADAAYQNPKSICPFHQMLLPRVIRDYDRINGLQK